MAPIWLARFLENDNARQSLDSVAGWVMQQVRLIPASDGGTGEADLPSQVPEVQVNPADSILIVIVKDAATRPLLNLECELINESDEPATVEWLAARIKDPHGSSFQLDWHIFYGGRPVMRKLSDVQPVELPPGESRVLGIQFAAPPEISEYTWTEGVYDVDLVGWVNGEPQSNVPGIKTSCRMELSKADTDYLRHWEGADETQWLSENN
jgi:hypothetical protein